MTVLPVIVVPFTAIVFWLLGGGSGETSVLQTKSGLNLQLPDAKISGQSMQDKLAFYALADRDSIKRQEQMRMDPVFSEKEIVVERKYREEPVNKRIGALQRQNAAPVVREREEPMPEQIIVQERTPRKEIDPEIEALNGALDKILEIQHPEKVKKEIPVSSRTVATVTSGQSSEDESYFGRRDSTTKNTFHSSGELLNNVLAAAIRAVVHGTQVLQTGSVIKIRLLQDMFVNGKQIPANAFVYGDVSIGNERMNIKIQSIQFDNSIYTVALTVYDMDGLAGINMPGSTGRDVAKESSEQAIQSFSPLTMESSIKAQAAAAGIGVAKSFLSKKVKLVRVTVKAGHMILLRDDNQKDY